MSTEKGGGRDFLPFFDFIFKIPMIYVYTKQKSIKISEILSSFCYTIYYFSKINPSFFFFSITEWLDGK